MNSLLLSPCLSPFDDVENGILAIYVAKAIRNVYRVEPTVFNLLADTPWILYRKYCLQQPPQPDLESDPAVKYTIFTFILLAFVLYLATLSEVAVINANGPVMNEGFAAFVGYLAAIGKPTVFWKDDVRRLYGGKDNPLVIGFMASISNRILAVDRLNFYDGSQASTCGPPYLDEQLRSLQRNRVLSAESTPNPKLMFLASMGQAMYSAVYKGARVAPQDKARNPFLMADADVYDKLKSIFKQFVSTSEFQTFYREDAQFLNGKL